MGGFPVMADQSLPETKSAPLPDRKQAADMGGAPDMGATRHARPDPARRALRIGASIVAALIGVLLLAWLVLYITKGRFLKHLFETYASQAVGRPVKVAGDFQFYFDFIDLQFRAGGMTVANPSWAKRPYFFSARLIDSRIATIPFIFGTHRVNSLLLDGGDVDLEWDAGDKHNTWTFGNPDKPGKRLELPVIRTAAVTGTTLHYRDPVMLLAADIAFQTIRAADTRFASDVRFTGTGTLRALPFTLAGSLLSPNQTVTGGRNRLELHARSRDTWLDVAGTLPAATRIEGADLALKVHGADLARLFDFLGVAVPDTRAYHFTSHLMKEDGNWKFTRLRGSFGNSDLAGAMTIARPKDRLGITADLASNAVDIIDVGPFVGYDPKRLEKEGGKGAVTRVAGVPRILPDAPLRLDAVQGFDAHVTYKVRTIRAPHFPVSNVRLTLDLDHGKLSLSPLTMDVSSGHLASDILIDTRRQPVFTDYDIRLAPTPMGALLKGFGVSESGTAGVIKARMKMSGRGDTVHRSLATANGRIAVILPKGTLWTRNVQLAELDVGTYLTKLLGHKLKKPVELNCGLIAFTVRDGIAAADPILLDTTKNVIAGRGGFSFRDESLDLAIRARAKTFSLFSAQSPIGVDGHFAAPGLKIISPQLLTRAGVGIGLGVIASPLAAVLAFVDPGDAKSAACGPVLAGADAAAQRTTRGKPRKDVGNGSPKP